MTEVPEQVGEMFHALMAFYDERIVEAVNMADCEEDYNDMVDHLDLFTVRKFNQFCKKNKFHFCLDFERVDEEGHRGITFSIARVH